MKGRHLEMIGSIKEKVIHKFRETYGGEGSAACYFAPGRINLIGEHTDYNGGHVFPCALTFGTYIAVRKRSDDVLRLSSVNFPGDGVIAGSLNDLKPLSDSSWTAYVKGVIWAVREHISGSCGAGDSSSPSPVTGMDIMIGGDVPAGAGLSSSASLEVAAGYMLSDQFGLGLSNQEIAIIGQRAENDFVGVNCGIMDQFASAMGRKGHAIFLDTNTLEYEYVPLDLEGCSIIITNTNKLHSLNDSEYNNRRRECGEALKAVNAYLAAHNEKTVDNLCALSAEDFDRVKECITDPVVMRRARHAVTEDRRTEDAVKVLQAGDIPAFGKLMNESHVSLRDDYEVSCPELDLLAETAWTIPGILGSRMTGGGFGGCTVSIVKDSSVDDYEKAAGEKYRKAFGYGCTFIRAAAGGGPDLITD